MMMRLHPPPNLSRVAILEHDFKAALSNPDAHCSKSQSLNLIAMVDVPASITIAIANLKVPHHVHEAAALFPQKIVRGNDNVFKEQRGHA